MPRDTPVFLYDADCGLCAWVVDALARSPRGRRIAWRAAQATAPLPAGLTTADTARAAWYVAGGRAHGGFAAFRRLALALPVLWPLAPLFWLPGAGVVGALVYRSIAARRRAISSRLGLAACRLPPPSPPRTLTHVDTEVQR